MTLSRRTMLAATPLTLAAAPALAAAELGLEPGAAHDQSDALQKAIDRAIAGGTNLVLSAGKYIAGGLVIAKPIAVSGSPGRTTLISPDGAAILRIRGTRHVSLHGIVFDGLGRVPAETRRAALLEAEDCTNLLLEACEFLGGAASGVALDRCAGRVAACRAGFCEETGLFAFDSRGLEISGCHVHDIGNNGIQVWASEKREDGTLVSGNRVERIAAKGGGTGQNGNGINIWKAGSVVVAGNRVTDCAFSAVRNNSGDNCQIVNNNVARLDEKALYVEFAYVGAVVSGNIVADAAFGISITNLDFNGHLATCTGNTIRDIRGGGALPETRGIGIGCEGEVAVTGNTVENAKDVGISLGWGPHCRNLLASGNVLSACGTGITVSLSRGAGPALIANNIISGATRGAIRGMDHRDSVTGDLALAGAKLPENLVVSGNLVT